MISPPGRRAAPGYLSEKCCSAGQTEADKPVLHARHAVSGSAARRGRARIAPSRGGVGVPGMADKLPTAYWPHGDADTLTGAAGPNPVGASEPGLPMAAHPCRTHDKPSHNFHVSSS